MEEGGRMSICTNYQKQEKTKLIKKMTKKKTKRKLEKLKTKTKIKIEWNSISIEYENHEKKKVTNYGQRHRTKSLG